MKPRYLVLGAAAVLAAASLTGCARIVPTGPMSSESPEIDGVTAVELNTAGDLTITQGEPALTIHAREGVLDILTADVVDGVLKLDRRPGPLPVNFGDGDVRYELSLPSLDAIEVHGAGDVDAEVATSSGGELRIVVTGAGDVDVDGIDAETVSISISGVGDVEVSGAARSLAVAIDGTGEVDADNLEVVDAEVEISGTGDAHVFASGTLRADVSGLGTVYYRGGPEVDADVSGLGEVVEDE